MDPTSRSTTPVPPSTRAPPPVPPRPQFSLLARIHGDTETHVSGPTSESKLVVDEYNIILRNPFRLPDSDPLQEKLDNGDSFMLNTLLQPGQGMYAKRMAELEIPCTFFCKNAGERGKHVKYAFHPFNMVWVLCESSLVTGEWTDLNDMTLDRFFQRDRYGVWRDESTGAKMRSATGVLVHRADEMFDHGYVFESEESHGKVEEVERPPTCGKRT